MDTVSTNKLAMSIDSNLILSTGGNYNTIPTEMDDEAYSYADDFTNESSSLIQEESIKNFPGSVLPIQSCSMNSFVNDFESEEISTISSAHSSIKSRSDSYTSYSPFPADNSESLSSSISSEAYSSTNYTRTSSEKNSSYDRKTDSAASSYHDGLESGVETQSPRDKNLKPDTTKCTNPDALKQHTRLMINLLKDFSNKEFPAPVSKSENTDGGRWNTKAEKARYNFIEHHVRRCKDTRSQHGSDTTGSGLRHRSGHEHRQVSLPNHLLSRLEKLKLENVTLSLKQKSRQLDEEIKEHQTYTKRTQGSYEADGRFFFLSHKQRLQKNIQERAIEQHQLDMNSVSLIGNLVGTLPRHSDAPMDIWNRLMKTAEAEPNH